MSSKFILRFDDITPEMAWSKFSAFEALASELDIPLLVGVVPHCLDPNLAREPERADFWDVVRGWVNRGWTVSQHGYTHKYVTKLQVIALSNEQRKQMGQQAKERVMREYSIEKARARFEAVYQEVMLDCKA